jgi:hypothetical protein
MLSFCFEHTFRASSKAALFAAYFHPEHVRLQDQRLDVIEREILELEDTGDALRRVSRVFPRRKLPALVRPLVSGPLHYLETVCWRKRDDEMDIETRPSLLSGRTTIKARYRVTELAPGRIHRRYEGSVSVDVALLSSRIERGIVAEYERSLPVAAACTQAWLDAAEAADRTDGTDRSLGEAPAASLSSRT